MNCLKCKYFKPKTEGMFYCEMDVRKTNNLECYMKHLDLKITQLLSIFANMTDVQRKNLEKCGKFLDKIEKDQQEGDEWKSH